MRPSRVIALAFSGVVLLVVMMSLGALVEGLDASQTMVIQYPNGTLRVAVAPGYYAQWWGSVTKYKKRDQLWFSLAENTPEGERAGDQSIPIRFNDGGHAKISGSLAWEMPQDATNVIALHNRYRSHAAIEQQLVRTVVEKAIYMTGPLMSSVESYAAKRGDLLNYVDEQIRNGVYKTESFQERTKDPLTGIERTVTVVKLVKGPKGDFLRQEDPPLDDFGIKVFNLAINRIPYEEKVEAQIKQQQDATIQIQTAIVRAKEAEQEAITVAKKGEAEAARAKWIQEAIKATKVTEAQQKLEVATLDARAADQEKRATILRGEGAAQARQLVMNADGALQLKLDAYIKVQEMYADAIAKYTGNWVPQIVTGGNTAAAVAGSGAQQMIDLLSIKAARDLGLDLGVSGAARTRPKGKE